MPLSDPQGGGPPSGRESTSPALLPLGRSNSFKPKRDSPYVYYLREGLRRARRVRSDARGQAEVRMQRFHLGQASVRILTGIFQSWNPVNSLSRWLRVRRRFQSEMTGPCSQDRPVLR